MVDLESIEDMSTRFFYLKTEIEEYLKRKTKQFTACMELKKTELIGRLCWMCVGSMEIDICLRESRQECQYSTNYLMETDLAESSI